MNLGQRLLNLRKSKHLSQEEAAEKLNVTRQTISKWETDQSTPDFAKIGPLCELYGITADELLTGKYEEKNEKEAVDGLEEELIVEKRAKGIAKAVFLYFVSVIWIMISIPVLMINPIAATAIFLVIVGLATYLIIYTCIVYKKKGKEEKREKNKLLKQIDSIISLITLIVYLFISFKTMAWHITWMIWLIYALVIEIIKLIFSLRVNMMKNSRGLKIFLIIFLNILAIVIALVMTRMINSNFKFSFFNKVSDNLVFDETYDVDFRKIAIKSVAGDIYIKESSTNEVRVIVYGDKEKSVVEVNDETLSINIEEKMCVGFCLGTTISKVEVYLPSTYENLMEIINQYGNIEIGNFSDAMIDIEEDCGDVSVRGGNVIKINDDYGDVEVGVANDIEIDMSCGDVEIDRGTDIIVNNQYGDIEINNVTNSLKLNNDCGDISVGNVSLNENSFIKCDYGDVYLGKTNEIYIDATTDLGNIEIKNNYRKSEVILKVENDCGDIEVDN